MMKFIQILILVLMLLNPGLSRESLRDSIYIAEIHVIGLKRTHLDVVLRELPEQIPGTLTQNQLDRFKQRLTNQLLYKNIRFNLENDILTIQIEEIFPMYLAPVFFLVDRSWEKINYGLEFTHFNFRGDKIFLSTSAWTGYNPGFKFNLMDDWVGKNKLIVGMNLSFQTNRHKLYDFDEDHTMAGLSLGKRLTNDISLIFNAGVHQFTPPKIERMFFQLNSNRYLYFQKSFSLVADNRDYKLFSTKGYYLNFSFLSEATSFTGLNYRHGISDIRFYLHNGPVSLGIRQYSHIASQQLPVYDAVYLGFSERIRGYFHIARSGRFLSLNQFEARFPLMNKREVSFFPGRSFPLNYLNNVNMGFYGAIFAESAMISSYMRRTEIKKAFSGYGFSFYLLLPYHNLLRFDLALNDRGRKTYIFEMRSSF